MLKNLSEDPGLTTYFFPGRDGVGGWGYPDESSSSSTGPPKWERKSDVEYRPPDLLFGLSG